MGVKKTLEHLPKSGIHRTGWSPRASAFQALNKNLGAEAPLSLEDRWRTTYTLPC
jgi:hypothetical protein